jgi:hypothetical protein
MGSRPLGRTTGFSKTSIVVTAPQKQVSENWKSLPLADKMAEVVQQAGPSELIETDRFPTGPVCLPGPVKPAGWRAGGLPP